MLMIKGHAGSKLSIFIEYLDKDTELAARQFNASINEPFVWLRVLGLEQSPSKTYRAKVVDETVKTFIARY